jgi:hypothetical protein
MDKMYESAAYRQTQRAKTVYELCIYTHRISGKISVSALYRTTSGMKHVYQPSTDTQEQAKIYE